MRKETLIRRLSWYYPLEKMHAVFTFPLAVVFCFLLYPVKDILFVVYGLIVCIFILYQGQLYWKLKLRRLKGKPGDQQKYLRRFRIWKRINVYLIALIPLVFFFWFYLSGWKLQPGRLLFWSAGINIFAVLEYVNYYHRQLMIDKVSDFKYFIVNKKLKIAHLRKNLNDNKI